MGLSLEGSGCLGGSELREGDQLSLKQSESLGAIIVSVSLLVTQPGFCCHCQDWRPKAWDAKEGPALDQLIDLVCLSIPSHQVRDKSTDSRGRLRLGRHNGQGNSQQSS